MEMQQFQAQRMKTNQQMQMAVMKVQKKMSHFSVDTNAVKTIQMIALRSDLLRGAANSMISAGKNVQQNPDSAFKVVLGLVKTKTVGMSKAMRSAMMTAIASKSAHLR
jgi:hypothetical protein